jgi:methionyl-tRNA formyltransferase
MSERMDEGDILQIAKINIDIVDKTPDIFRKFVNIGPNLLYSAFQKIIS